MVPVVPLGEVVMHLPLQTSRHNKGEAPHRRGIWLCAIERTEEALIGTTMGVVKCRIVSRMVEGERWNGKFAI